MSSFDSGGKLLLSLKHCPEGPLPAAPEPALLLQGL